MSKTVINKFPINTISENLQGIANVNVSNHDSKTDLDYTRLSLPCYNATNDFRIQICFTFYSGWQNGGRFIGDGDDEHWKESNDYRIFFTGNLIYYDFNSLRKSTSSSNYYGKICNFEIGNYYIKNLDNNTNIISGTKQTDLTKTQTHLRNLQLFGQGDSGIVYSLKIYEDGVNLTYDIIPYNDSDGYCLYDRISQRALYRPANITQVKKDIIQTRVQDLFWDNILINKAYVGTDCIWMTTNLLPSEIYVFNSENPESLSGYANKLIVFPETYTSTLMTSFKIQVKVLGFKVTGGTLVRQIRNGTTVQYNRFFATSNTNYYMDYASTRISTTGPDFFASPRELEFGHEKTMNSNKMYIKDLSSDTIITSTNISASANAQNAYPWSIWGNSNEIYGFAYLRFYKSINYGQWELVHDYEARKADNGLGILYDKVTGNTLTHQYMYAYEYRQL